MYALTVAKRQIAHMLVSRPVLTIYVISTFIFLSVLHRVRFFSTIIDRKALHTIETLSCSLQGNSRARALSRSRRKSQKKRQ